VTTTGAPVESEMDPRLVHPERRHRPVGEVKEILIEGRKLKIGGDLKLDQEQRIT